MSRNMLNCQPLCQFSNRLFFTTFAAPAPHSAQVNRAAQESSPPKIRSNSRAAPTPPEEQSLLYHFFTIDEDLTYMSFFEDWGPLNIAMIYRACIYIHELLEDTALKRHRLVLYSSEDPRRKANAALLMALYMLVVLHRPPWEAFHPISELEFMPFRDAGRGRSDFDLSIHDCLWGFWKAQRNGLISMNDFSLQEYEFYEKVENGDWNWITPGFIAFASPSDTVWIRQQKSGTTGSPDRPNSSTFERKLSQPFQNCLDYFDERDVKLVIRLNNPLYDKSMFEERGIEHLELYFDDGTNPTDDIVRTFITKSEMTFEAGGVVAVHCKAGLGRTGTLIGAYLIYKYDFTANEAIAFMRICRPGCVVGPQQQYLYQRQADWIRWSAVDQGKKELEVELSARPPVAPVFSTISKPVTPPIEEKPLPSTPNRPSLVSVASAAEVEAMLPPGQPRKTPTGKRVALEMLGDDEEDEGAASDDSMGAVQSNSKNRGTAPVTKQSRLTGPSGTKVVIKAPTAIGGSLMKESAINSAIGPKPVSVAPDSPQKSVRASPRLQDANARRTAAKSVTSLPRINAVVLARPPVANPSALRQPREDATSLPLAMRTRSTTTDALAQPAQRTHSSRSNRISRPAASKIPSRKLNRAASPPPTLGPSSMTPVTVLSGGAGSRLPTLKPTLPAKAKTLPAVPTVKAVLGTLKEQPAMEVGMSNGLEAKRGTGAMESEDAPNNAWMSGADAKAIVEPGSKTGGRPSIRSVRRRRSSFSSADIM